MSTPLTTESMPQRSATRAAPEWATTTLAPIIPVGARAGSAIRELLPLWRHAIWLVLLFAVTGFAVSVRLDVQSMRKDLDRNARLIDDARLTHDRLQLELDARRRVVAVDAVADALNLIPGAKVIDLGTTP